MQFLCLQLYLITSPGPDNCANEFWNKIFTPIVVGKHTERTDKQTGTETKKRTFTDAVKKGRLPQDLLSKGPVEQLNEVYGKELNRLGRAS